MGGACSTHGEKRNAFRILVGKARRKETTRNTYVDGRIILRWILEREDGAVLAGFIWLRIGTGGGLL
jgi:hypothetical protein